MSLDTSNEQTESAAGASSSALIANRSSLSLIRLFQLVSPALPIGAYHFSQGLEYASDAAWLHDEVTACEWISGIAQHAIGTLDVPVLLRLHDSWSMNDLQQVEHWSRYLVACRENVELRTEERHIGKALAKVLVELQIDKARDWIHRDDTSYAAMFALAATQWHIDRTATAQAYLWAWHENQVLAALKLLPIGQSAGQRILNKLMINIPPTVERACTLTDDDIGITTPMQGIASSQHETQYSRLFRS
jgi:urease accessory protein